MSFLLLSNWFDREGFQAWKLNTWQDWVMFGFAVLLGVFGFWFAIRKIKKNRTPERAAERVARKLIKLGGKDARVYRDIIIENSRGMIRCDMLYLSQDRLHPVKVFNRGVTVSGQMGSKNWVIGDNEGNTTVLNPLITLGKQKDMLNYFFVENHLGKVPMDPIVVFADTYSYPHIKIFGFTSAVAYRDLRKWRKERPMSDDVRWKRDKVVDLLEAAMADTPAREARLAALEAAEAEAIAEGSDQK